MMESERGSDSNARDTVRVMAGLFLSLFTIFCMVSLVSFLFTWIPDQSLEMNPDFLNDSVGASNWGGKLGYKLAAFLFSSLFGFGAFAVPIFSGISAVACFRVREVNLFKVLLICLFGCVVVSLACSYICSFSPSYMALFGNGTGGSYGFYANKWLISMLGSFGTGCLVFFVCSVWGMFLSKRVTSWIGLVFDKLFSPRPGKTESVESESEQMPGEEDGEQENEEQECPEVPESEMELGGEIELESVDVPVTESESPDGNADSISLDEVVLPSFEDVAPENYSQLDETDSESAEPEEVSVSSAEPMTDGVEETDGKSGKENTTSSFEVVENENPDELPLAKWREKYDPRLSLSHFKLPSTDFLDEYADSKYVPTRAELEQNNLKIVQALRSYKISVTKVSAKVGPTVTLFEVVPAPGVKVSQIKSREEDIARELAAVGVRVVFIPGSNAIGIEVANSKASIVSMRSVLEDIKFRESKMELPVAIGKTISNETMIFDLAKMPHLLVAGATGQGKSVGLNAIITSLLYKKHPSELKLVLVDPKKV
ncbi:MAG: DNA translocase FtsK, partial [Alistipes sp.]|nr:DNA translocase FtsK [Candidatus Minthomonas equi]